MSRDPALRAPIDRMQPGWSAATVKSAKAEADHAPERCGTLMPDRVVERRGLIASPRPMPRKPDEKPANSRSTVPGPERRHRRLGIFMSVAGPTPGEPHDHEPSPSADEIERRSVHCRKVLDAAAAAFAPAASADEEAIRRARTSACQRTARRALLPIAAKAGEARSGNTLAATSDIALRRMLLGAEQETRKHDEAASRTDRRAAPMVNPPTNLDRGSVEKPDWRATCWQAPNACANC